MKRRQFTVVAGIPPGLGARFEDLFNRQAPGWRIITRRDLDPWKPYTSLYASKLYRQLTEKLRKLEPTDRRKMLADVNVILLYLTREDGSESALCGEFRTETLIVPLARPNAVDLPQATPNEQRRVVNALVRNGIQSVRQAARLLAVIAEEVTNRDNRTCLLLPPKNSGRTEVCDCVQNAVLERKEVNVFKEDLRRVCDSLAIQRGDKHTRFVGKRGLEFKSPSRHARHGCAPTWEEGEHNLSCVLRGRLRFGAPYDPSFHYDCSLAGVKSRDFPSCHGGKKLPSRRRHVNIAPNDNVR